MVTNEPQPDGTPSDTKYTGRQWHSDMSFTPKRLLLLLLRCHAVPEVGGDTLCANIYIGERVKRFEGMTEEESRPMIDFLVGHASAQDSGVQR